MGLQFLVIQMTQEFAIVQQPQVEALIQTYLERVGQELQAERGGFLLINEPKSQMKWFLEWPGEGDSFKEPGKKISLKKCGWMMELFEIQKGFSFGTENWDQQAFDEKKLFEKWGCPSVICVPVVQNGIKGFCYWGRSAEFGWGIGELGLLRQVANIFGIGLKRLNFSNSNSSK